MFKIESIAGAVTFYNAHAGGMDNFPTPYQAWLDASLNWSERCTREVKENGEIHFQSTGSSVYSVVFNPAEPLWQFKPVEGVSGEKIRAKYRGEYIVERTRKNFFAHSPGMVIHPRWDKGYIPPHKRDDEGFWQRHIDDYELETLCANFFAQIVERCSIQHSDPQKFMLTRNGGMISNIPYVIRDDIQRFLSFKNYIITLMACGVLPMTSIGIVDTGTMTEVDPNWGCRPQEVEFVDMLVMMVDAILALSEENIAAEAKAAAVEHWEVLYKALVASDLNRFF